MPRDWCTTVGLDPSTRIGWAGGYVGLGVSSSNLSGRTLADLILGQDTDLTRLPWVNRKVRPWESFARLAFLTGAPVDDMALTSADIEARGRRLREAAFRGHLILGLSRAIDVHGRDMSVGKLHDRVQPMFAKVMDDAKLRRGMPCVHLEFPRWAIDLLPPYLIMLAYQLALENPLLEDGRSSTAAAAISSAGAIRITPAMARSMRFTFWHSW